MQPCFFCIMLHPLWAPYTAHSCKPVAGEYTILPYGQEQRMLANTFSIVRAARRCCNAASSPIPPAVSAIKRQSVTMPQMLRLSVYPEWQSTPRGFEPLRAEPNGFRIHLLSRSDTVSSAALGTALLYFPSTNATRDIPACTRGVFEKGVSQLLL